MNNISDTEVSSASDFGASYWDGNTMELRCQKIKRDTEITTEYVNNKLEQILSALFDTLEEYER